MKLTLLALAITLALRAGGLDLTPPTRGPVVDGAVIVESCDRLVCARVKKIHEYEVVGGKPTLRIAELDLMLAAQPFGSKGERVLVRLVDDGPPPDLAYWPLGRNLMRDARDGDILPGIEAALGTEQLWMPVARLSGPWPIEERSGTYAARVPATVIASKDKHPTDTEKPVEWLWIPQGEVHRAVVAEVTRIEPRTEAAIFSTGPSNWELRIDGNGAGVVSGVRFQWTEDQRAAWAKGLEAARFQVMPLSIGSSSGPCSAVTILSLVTSEGRRTVRSYGDIMKTEADRKWVPEFERLWSALSAAVPQETK